ncbi:MAG: bifunctional [glutamate--ammonia ligase]-adenylyl-L-tyrosine phosphorylase/[glutamate--ammonia-ligase] adenylyltransferase, partial [Pseudomonadota bacterium]
RGKGVRISRKSKFIRDAVSVFALSDFVFKSVSRTPDILNDLIQKGDLDRSYPEDALTTGIAASLSNMGDAASLPALLRKYRCREMVRIAWRDLIGASDFFETVSDLTRFADALIGKTLSVLYDRECAESGVPENPAGIPQHLVVIGMGKLGGEELNFSSDVDLIFAYPDAGMTRGRGTPVTNEEFFTRLCRRLIKVLGSQTPDGPVFRVDTRLRPDGDNGPIVMSFDGMEHYYQIHGREWERYAWIKARIVAGDKKAGEKLLKRLNPFIFRRYLDYGAFEALRDMKRKITFEIKRRKIKDDVKIGAGGIREIEFFGQIFQLIRGGVEPILQERRILKVLQTLEKENYISKDTFEQLREAYIFLRNTEHRLQEFSDQQTHRLPDEPMQKARLSASMGFNGWEGFAGCLAKQMNNVHKHFNGLLKSKDPEESAARRSTEEIKFSELSEVWQGLVGPETAAAVLAKTGFDDHEKAMNLMNLLRNDPSTRALSHDGRNRLDRLMPDVLSKVGLAEDPVQTLSCILDLVKTIQRRTSYLALLLENPRALSHLIKLTNVSPWIASFLTNHPVLLDELLDERTLYAPPKIETLKSDLKERLAKLSSQDLEYQIEELCIFKQINTLRVAASDITGVLPLMRVSDHLSGIAEAILDQVLEISWRHLVERHGNPGCRLEGLPCGKGFAMIAYGKLGGLELGYKSDLDLVFLHAGIEGTTTGGLRPIENAQFFTRLGQRVVHILTAHTRAGTLYETDMRLRPSGSGGILVSHIEAFREYQLKQAWMWEHQALIRARPIGGDSRLADRFEAIRKEALSKPRDVGRLKESVKEMRERMRKEHLKEEAGGFDLKQGRGGIVDIEFLVQYLVLLNAGEHPSLLRWTDNVRILQSLSESGVIDEETAYFLRKAFLIYRSTVHRLNLRERSTRVPAETFSALREGVIRIWSARLGD